MKSIINFSLKNKLAIWLLTILIIGSGIFSVTSMKKESIPNINIPYLLIFTSYPGATAEQIMDEIGEPLENTLNNISDVNNVTVTTYSNFAMISAEFDYGTDTKEKEDEIKEAMDKLDLPEQVSEPQVMAISMDMVPILTMSISEDSLSESELTDYINSEVISKVQKIKGVSEASISGAYYEDNVITFDQAKLAAFGLTKEEVKQTIDVNNFNMPLGLYEFENSVQSVVINNKIDTINNLKELTFIDKKTGKVIKLKDFATIETIGKIESISRTNGKSSMALAVTKTNDANTVEISDEVLKVMDNLKDKNKNLDYLVTFDQAVDINDSVSTMLSKAIFGAAVAMFVILIFLRNIRTTIISVVSIPLSLLMAFLALDYIGVTLNLLTLGAMTVSIGRVIDDSIVVVENIYRRLSESKGKIKPRELIASSTVEMFIPILSSTLVTIAVFLPIALVGGMIGELFMPFALTMAFALISSLIVAVTIVPIMAHTLFKKELKGIKIAKEENHKGKLTNFYKKALNWSLNHKFIVSFITVLLLVLSMFLFTKLGFSFMNEEKTNQLTLNYEAKTDTLDSDIEKAMTEVESKFLKDKKVETVSVSLGSSSDMAALMGGSDATVTLLYKDSVKDIEKVQSNLEEEIKNYNTDKGTWSVSSASSSMMSSGGLSFEVYGNSIDELEPVVSKIEKIMKDNKDLKNIESNLSISYEEKTLVVNKEKTTKLGVNPYTIMGMIYSMEGKTDFATVANVDLVEVTESKKFKNIDEVLNTYVPTATGALVQVKDVVTVKDGKAPYSLTKNGGKYFVTVSAELKVDNVSDVSKKVNDEIKNIKLPKNVSFEEAGVTTQMNDAFYKLGLAILAAIGIVYFILVVTFKEGLAPFAILFSLPLTIIGAVLGLLIGGVTFDVSAMLGILMLIGIVVTNAIVLIDRIINNEINGLERREAIIEAGETRLRPILMTALATIGALLPMVLGQSAGGVISEGLALTVIGGLTSSTLLTLIIVPLVFEGLSNLFRKNRKEKDE